MKKPTFFGSMGSPLFWPSQLVVSHYTGVEKREEHAGRKVIWQVAARRSTYKKHGKRSVLYKAIRKIEKAKAQVRAKVEHPFRVIKR